MGILFYKGFFVCSRKGFFSVLVFARGFPALVGVGCWWEGGFESFSSLFLLASGQYLHTACVLFCAFLQAPLIY